MATTNREQRKLAVKEDVKHFLEDLLDTEEEETFSKHSRQNVKQGFRNSCGPLR